MNAIPAEPFEASVDGAGALGPCAGVSDGVAGVGTVAVVGCAAGFSGAAAGVAEAGGAGGTDGRARGKFDATVEPSSGHAG